MSGLSAARQRGLTGKRVLVTRPRHQAAALSDPLRELGAVPVELPVIEVVPAPDADLDSFLDRIDEYDWIVFTSVNAVSVVAGRLAAEGRPKVAAIGDATAAALKERGLAVDLVPNEFVAEAVLEALDERGVAGKRFLLPRADIARDALPDGLRAAGAIVDVVTAYTTVRPADIDREIVEMLRAGQIDVVTFTSPSTVRNLMELLGGALPESVQAACIGPITARAAELAGLRVDIVASEYSIPGLIHALLESDDDEHV